MRLILRWQPIRFPRETPQVRSSNRQHLFFAFLPWLCSRMLSSVIRYRAGLTLFMHWPQFTAAAIVVPPSLHFLGKDYREPTRKVCSYAVASEMIYVSEICQNTFHCSRISHCFNCFLLPADLGLITAWCCSIFVRRLVHGQSL